MRVRINNFDRKLHSPFMAMLLALGSFVLLGAVFRYEPSAGRVSGHRSGQTALLPLDNAGPGMTKWLDMHDPTRIARGTAPKLAVPREAPADTARPDPRPVIPVPTPVAPAAFSAGPIPKDAPPVTDTALPATVYPALPPENYPRVTINGAKLTDPLPEELLKLAAAGNAGTAELRFSRGILPGELRTTIVRSSGNVRVDQELVRRFSGLRFAELPARVRVVWDAAGETSRQKENK